VENRQRRQWIEGFTSPHQKSVPGSSSATDRHITRLLCCVHRMKLKERKRFVVRLKSTLLFERNYLHLFFYLSSSSPLVPLWCIKCYSTDGISTSFDSVLIWTSTQHVIHISLATSSPKRRKPFIWKLSEQWSAPVRRVLIHPLHVQLRLTYATQLLKVCSLQSLRECRQSC